MMGYSLPLFLCYLQPQGEDEQKSDFFLLLGVGNFCFGSASFCPSQSFSLDFFGHFLFPVRMWRRKLF